MVKEIEIPEGYEAKIVDNKVVLELKESEDERIRKEIQEFLRNNCGAGQEAYKKCEEWCYWIEKQKERGPLTKEEEYTLARIIEYVEDNDCPAEWKNLLHDVYSLPYQKEQKPAEWSDEDENKLEQCIRIVSGWEGDCDIVKSPYSNFLKSLRPQLKQEWSEEDEADANLILKELEEDKKDSPDYSKHFARLIDWFTLRFKSLRPQPHWKPSEEQIEAILDAETLVTGNTLIYLNSLYEQLKRL